MEISLIVLTGLCILFATIKMLRHPHWAIRLFDFPQVQILFLCVLVFILDLFLLSFNDILHLILMAGLVGAIVLQVRIIIPYTPFYPRQSRSSTSEGVASLSIMVSNVYMNNRAYDKLTSLAKKWDPDILITLETDKGWEEGMTELEDDYKYCCKIPLDNMYGMHVYSKLKLNKLRQRYIVEDDVPSVTAELHLKKNLPVMFYAIHPKPPSPTENEESTERDGELFLISREIEKLDMPVVVAGDLNDVAWSHSTRLFQRLSTLLDPRIGRGFFNTFHAKMPLLRWPLDHIFHSDHFTINKIARLPGIGSDHFPMYISLDLHTSGQAGFQPEEPDSEDKEEAKETIKNALDN